MPTVNDHSCGMYGAEIDTYEQYIILAILAFAIIQSQPWDEKYSIKLYNSTPGVYFEQIGQVKLYNDELTLVTFLDLHTHNEKFTQLNHYYNQVIGICDHPKIGDYRYFQIYNSIKVCNTFLTSAKQNLIKIQEEKSILEQMAGYFPLRNKRAYFDGVGSLAKTLFGTLDAEDRDYYNSQIQLLTEGEKSMNKLIQEQTVILKSTISNFNSTVSDLVYNENLLVTNLNKIEASLKNESAQVNNLEIKVLLDEYIEIFDVILQQYQLETLTLIDSILIAQKGQLHPMIISPSKFIFELQTLLPALPNKLSFPISLTIENIHTFLNLISLTVYFNSGNLVYVISVPLTSDNDYNILKLTPFPNHLIGNKYTFIQPVTEYLAVSIDKQQYFLMTINNLENCRKYDHYKYLCKQMQPIYLAHKTELCEIELFNAVQKIPETCDKRMIEIRSNLFTQLLTSNSWLFVAPNTGIFTVRCKNFGSKDISLAGIGKIWLEKTCMASSSTVTLRPHGKIIKSNISLDFVPNIDLQNFVIQSLSETNINISNLKLNKNYKNIARNLQDLQVASYRLDEIQEISRNLAHELNTKSVVGHHSYFISALGCILALLIIYFLIRKLVSMNWNFKLCTRKYNFRNPERASWQFDRARGQQTETL